MFHIMVKNECSDRWFKLLRVQLINRNLDAVLRNKNTLPTSFILKYYLLTLNFKGSIATIDKSSLNQGMKNKPKKFNCMWFLWL